MPLLRAKYQIERLLELADVKIGGERPWDIAVHDDAMYNRVLSEGSLGLGESYMDGWWDCPRLDHFFCKLLSAGLATRIRTWSTLLDVLIGRIWNLQNVSRAFQIGRHHYDIGNELYRSMLGESMIYSCGYWRSAASLDQAQEAKLDLVCRKLELRPGMRVLDIGCGWGGAAKFATERYGVEVVGVTVSREQFEYAKENCRGLPAEFRLQDYRALNEQFDCIFSLGMFEHVGYKNYREYMRVVRRCLRPNGAFLLHTIGGNEPAVRGDPWLERYIFPNSLIPCASQIARAAEGLFVMEDWQNFGVDYDNTLMCWFANFEAAWPELKSRYDERFQRMWTYYLLSGAGTFRARRRQLWQVLYTTNGLPGGFRRWSDAKPAMKLPSEAQESAFSGR